MPNGLKITIISVGSLVGISFLFAMCAPTCQKMADNRAKRREFVRNFTATKEQCAQLPSLEHGHSVDTSHWRYDLILDQKLDCILARLSEETQ